MNTNHSLLTACLWASTFHLAHTAPGVMQWCRMTMSYTTQIILSSLRCLYNITCSLRLCSLESLKQRATCCSHSQIVICSTDTQPLRSWVTSPRLRHASILLWQHKCVYCLFYDFMLLWLPVCCCCYLILTSSTPDITRVRVVVLPNTSKTSF